jgi:hypothetical protein
MAQAVPSVPLRRAPARPSRLSHAPCRIEARGVAELDMQAQGVFRADESALCRHGDLGVDRA